MPWIVLENAGVAGGDAPKPIEIPDAPVLIGRGADADVRIDDPKVSAKHLRLRPLGDGETWVARDLGSRRGTLKDGTRILRVRIRDGDVLEVGGTTLRFLREKPAAVAAAPVLGGTLQWKAASTATPEPASAVRAPTVSAPPPPSDASAPRFDGRGLKFALVWFGVGVAALAVVFFGLMPRAKEAKQEAEVRRELRDALSTADMGIDTFEEEIEAFLAQHPDLEETEQLREVIAAMRAREADRLAYEHRILNLTEDLYGLPDSEVRGRLIELAASMPEDSDLARQVAAARGALDRRHAAAEQLALDGLLAATDRRIAAGDPAGAMRRLTAFRTTWPGPSRETLRRLKRTEDTAILSVKHLYESALADAEAEADPSEARRILARAWRGLEGTPQANRVADLLRFTRRPGSRRLDMSGADEPSGPETDGTEPEILARAAVAENLVRGRKWRAALSAFAALVGEAEPGLLRREWEIRVREMSNVTSLVDTLKEAGGGDKPYKVKLSAGRVRVRAADDDGVVLERGGSEQEVAWADVPDDDLLPLLTPRAPKNEQRLGLAVLAASLGLREALVDAVSPLFEKGVSLEEANSLVARHLHGRATPPPGGYRLYRGEILDAQAYQRKIRAEQGAKFEEKARGILARIRKDPSFKKLEKMKALRAQLDERRLSAVLAIFNETHYPYPANKSSQQYQAVQKEIDRRVDLVREIWEDPLKLKLERKGRLGRALDDWQEVLDSMKAIDADVLALEKAIAPYTMYVDKGSIPVRDFYSDEDERERFAYNDWVMNTYNPEQKAYATEVEQAQTRVTNAYRRMMGYAVAVKPGGAAYEAINSDSVKKVLDAGKIVGRPIGLLAVRIDDRLVQSSRAHSEDMASRGFFNHFAPPNPATGAPGTSPFDRMQAAGYKGRGMSENIAAGASSPEQAHTMWVHSSGHHRNILSPWTDQGVGRSGRHWTQNFGASGQGRPKIPSDTPATDVSKSDAPQPEAPAKR